MKYLSIHFNYLLPIIFLLVNASCSDNVGKKQIANTNEQQSGFRILTSDQSGVQFANKIINEDETFNCFNFFNIYNGGGVATGDINNDGLSDIYFTGNQVENKLYLNKGNLKFEDITSSARVQGKNSWTTGVTMVDVNGDGWLDIYVCQSGGEISTSEERRNLLYINNQDLTFTESGKEFGIDDDARSNHAAFFDFDHDGDLDLYVVNHPLGFGDYISTRLKKSQNPSDIETDKLFRNDRGVEFTEVTNEAGLRNYGFGLSVTVSDFNNDGWSDLYVANDYSEPDHYYLNNGDGTFRDEIHSAFKHISQFSMGSDAGDLNNDGLSDLIVLDMMAEDNFRKKTNMQGMDIQAFYTNYGLGRHLQYMQNMLQLNRGDNNFSEIAELAGIAYTDWSWSPLICDFDNDGLKDLYITNGIKRDLRNNDFQKSIADLSQDYILKNHQEVASQIPSKPIDNYLFRNVGDLTFKRMNENWNLSFNGFSSGSAYADFDNDGDLDLVLNNLEDQSLVIENQTSKSNFIGLRLIGDKLNSYGVGSKVTITTNAGIQYAELNTSHGFLSSSEPELHFGLGTQTKIEEIRVIWPNQKVTLLKDVEANQTLTINYGDSKFLDPNEINLTKKENPLFSDVTENIGIDFKHNEIFYEDYDREILLPHRYSQLGPFLSVGDANGDGLDDFFVGGASGQPGILYLQQKVGSFEKSKSQPWSEHSIQEDMGSLFIDIDNDSDLDLYVTSGSNEWEVGSSKYQDRIYVNDGQGNFQYDEQRIPENNTSTSCIAKADFDQDGDLDLFVGGRVTPGKFPVSPTSYILTNNNGIFKNETEELAPALKNLGMVTDAQWVDVDNDQDLDLIVVGEWMPITILENENGQLTNITSNSILKDYTGWWYSISSGDFDNDGDLDFIVGNLGLNSKYQTNEGPVQVYAGDLDQNGRHDIILGYHSGGKCFPVRGRTCSSQQIPEVSKKIATYDLFGNSSLFEVYGEELSKAFFKEANWFASSYVENLGNGQFKLTALPKMAQFSTVNSSIPIDVNGDGYLDVLLAGNMHSAEIETARHDASYGSILLGDGKGNFLPQDNKNIGLQLNGDVKDVKTLDWMGSSFLISKNNDSLQIISRIIK